MALSFQSGSVALATWGFSVGDIATIAGAGRKAGTWIMAQFRDRALFDWMNVDIDTVFRRKGLFVTAILQKRWDEKFILMKNGKRTIFSNEHTGNTPLVQQMDRFTWLMTLLTAVLDAAMQPSDRKKVLVRLLLRLFEDHKESAEFLNREANEHIEGWMSAACVRGISKKARDHWNMLGHQGKHQHGYIPEAESSGIIQFLTWLIQDQSKVYTTSSTDIFSLAVILEELGMRILLIETGTVGHVDESDTVVRWNSTIAPAALVKSQRTIRSGMRIPLNHMEEVASLFHQSLDRDRMRSYFQLGMDAVRQDGLSLLPSHSEDDPPRVKGSPFLRDEQDLMIWVESTSTISIPRVGGDVYRLMDWLFPVPTPATVKGLLKVVDELSQSHVEAHNIQMIALSMDNASMNSRSYGLDKAYNYGDALHWLQAFFLGYWYQLLLPLLDTTQLATQEAFGAWGWGDIQCLNLFREIVHTRLHQRKQQSRIYMLHRFEVLKLAAYLFGGSEQWQVETAKYGAIGILGKLPILYTSLVAGGPHSFGKFSLLDIDPSCIPSGTSGVVYPGHAGNAPKRTPDAYMMDPTGFQEVILRDLRIAQLREECVDDFTIHIEPDWDYDSQTCLVTYRHRGRLVQRLNPRQIDLVLGGQTFTDREPDPVPENVDNSPPYLVPTMCTLACLNAYEGGFSVEPEERLVETTADCSGYTFNPIITNVSKAMNAMVCISSTYEGWTNRKGLSIVSSQAELDTALNQHSKVILLRSGGMFSYSPSQ
ncbi:MAG: hypothetical protein Q9168_001637 [Polycauliona sp. 1 TL-2023]